MNEIEFEEKQEKLGKLLIGLIINSIAKKLMQQHDKT